MSNLALQFEILQGGQVARTETLDQDVIKVGKLASSHLRLDDPNVSRIHAVIERAADGTFSVIDLGSATGTFVNGEKVTKASLNAGDQLQFGDTVIRVEIVSPQAAAAAAAPAVEPSVAVASAGAAAAPAYEVPAAPTSGVTLDDGSVVEPYTLQGYYDDAGNYIPGYYDEAGNYHHGYGFYDEAGQWQVSLGYYDPAGEWVSTDGSSVAAAGAGLGEESSWLITARDTDTYQEAYFGSRGGDTLEVAMLWQDHVLVVNSYDKPRTITIGTAEKNNDFTIEDPSITDERFPLVEYGGSYSLNFTAGMSGQVQVNGQLYSLEEAIQRGVASRSGAGFSIPLDGRSSARVDMGDITFLVHFTDVPVAAFGGKGFDKGPIPFYLLSAVAHLSFLFLAMSMPDNVRGLDLDGFQANDRFVQLMIEPEQVEEEKPDWLDGGGDEEAAAKHKGEEGQAGKEDAEATNKKLAIKGDRNPEDLELKRAMDTEVAMNAGIAGELMVSSPFGSSDTSVGSDAIHALGNLQGGEFGESKGFGGLGLHGAGRGGGGISERGIGLANVGTAGRGGGGRGGSGYGKGAGDLGERNSRVPKIVPGEPQVQGSLDREIIRRVVRQHRGEIKFCYESELQKNKGLGGRVLVRFTISATGSVVSAVVKETSLNNATVERCITDKIRRWVFPEPKGGGIVMVNYPFNLSS